MSRGNKYIHLQTINNQIKEKSFEELYGDDPLVRKHIEAGTLITSVQYFCAYFNGGNEFGSYYTIIPFINEDPIDKVVFKEKEQMINFCRRLNITNRSPYIPETS
jgi:hypothetical protein